MPMRSERRDDAIAAALIAAGAVVRLAGWTTRQLFVRATETEHVAYSLVTTGRFADAFGPGSGPTAHVSPAMPWLMAAVYRLFGLDTPRAEFVLAAIAVGLVAAATWFAWRLFARLGAGRGARLAATAVLALLPIQFALEAVEMRVWEGPLTVATLLGVLLWLVTLDGRPALTLRALVPPMVPIALLVLASPPAALALVAALAILASRRLPLRQCLAAGAIMLAGLIAVSLPVALHNRATLGRLIWTRSNANLELAVAYNDTLLDAPAGAAGYRARLAEIHPDWPGGTGYAALVAAGGEIAYNDRLGVATRDWMARHPGGTARLVLRHVRQYLAPPGWFFYPFGTVSRSALPRAAFLAATLTAALGGGVVLAARDRRYLYVVVPLVLVMLPYVVAQPILRYRYLAYALSVFLAFEVIGRLVPVRAEGPRDNERAAAPPRATL